MSLIFWLLDIILVLFIDRPSYSLSIGFPLLPRELNPHFSHLTRLNIVIWL